MDKKKWLVTGAAGFLGSHVAEQLMEKQQMVVAVDDLSWGNEEFIAPYSENDDFEFFKTDIRQTDALKKILASHQPDFIVHLAALHFIPLAMKQPTWTIDINVKGTQALLEAAREVNYTAFWFASTGDVYKTTEEPLIEHETPKDPYNIYGMSKLMGEQLLKLESELHRGRAYIAGRLFNLIGPRETNPHIVPEIMKQLKENPKELQLGNITPVRDYVPVDQAAQAIIDMCLKSKPGFIKNNVATGVGQSVGDLIKTIEKVLGHDITVHKDPDRVRPVDRPKLVAKVDQLKENIGWAPSHKVEEILTSLLKAEGLA